MNALRLHHGISVKDFEHRTGLTLKDVQKPVDRAVQLGLLEVSEQLQATDHGQQYLNELLSLFLTE